MCHSRNFFYFLIACNIGIINCASGYLDVSYGNNNIGIITPVIGRNNNLCAVAIRPNDYLFGIGSVQIVTTGSGICSLNPVGNFDIGFNGIGFTQLLIGSETTLTCITTQADGKAVAGGYIVDNTTKGIIVRYNTDGSLDTNFNTTGYILVNFPGGSSIYDIIVQSDGKIVAGGISGEGAPMFTLIRYNADGSLDTTFGNNGVSRINPGYTSTPNAIALQDDGKIIIAGWAWNFVTTVCALARFNADGTCDQSFGTNGLIIEQLGASSQIQAILIQPDGKIIAGGFTTNDNFHYSFALLRYTDSGTRDTTFNGIGLVTTSIPYSCQLQALALQPSGNIIAGGSNFGALTTNFALACYLPSGALNTSFGTNGITLTSIGSNAEIKSIVIQSDNKIVAAGISDEKAAIARYLP